MSFIQYDSISNHTDKRTLNEFLDANPDFLNEKYIVEHKYDGSNFQVIFTKNSTEPPTFASRNQILTDSDKFFNYKQVVKSPKYKEMFDKVQLYLNSNANIETINLFGELYGQVQDRVKYFDARENRIIFFDVYFDQEVQTQKVIEIFPIQN
jgi:hypothetical protein